MAKMVLVALWEMYYPLLCELDPTDWSKSQGVLPFATLAFFYSF